MKRKRQILVITAFAVALVCGLVTTEQMGLQVSLKGPHPPKAARSGPGQAASLQRTKEQRESKGEGAEEETVEGQIVNLLSKRWDTSDPEARQALLDELLRLEKLRKAEVEAKARELGLPLITDAGAALVGFEGELPLYDISHNAEAAISTATDLVRETLPYNVDGYGHKIGLWDVIYAPNLFHQEFDGGIDLKDDATPGGLHATHVAATMIGKGIDPLAKGMAPRAKVWAHSSTDVLTELAAAASTGNDDFGDLYVSVHPYGAAIGWENDRTAWYGVFIDDESRNNDYAPLFGQYSSTTAAWDGLVKTFPYHLMVKSAGNHADDKRPNEESEAYWSLNGTGRTYEFDAQDHPKADKRQYNVTPLGFGTLDARASAKNILTVGSVSDAVTGGVRDLSATSLSDFSSAGPTDDGRIKPDLVTNGESVYSADGYSTDAYSTSSGTSMAAASAGGSALLLVDLHKDLSGKAMKASSLKGLLIHTADDLGNPGPDYRHGWGLLNTERAAQLLVDHDAAGGLGLARLREDSLRSEGDNDYYVIEHDGVSPLRVTLCWTDEAGAWTSGHDNRTRRLVNDLSLCLVGPDATIYHPYVMPFTSTFAKEDLDAPAVTGVNSVDNVEQIFLPNAPAGIYTIQVNLAGTLTGTAQEYSLLLSGNTLPGPGVEVEQPVADQAYLVLDTDKIDDVCDPNLIFSGQDHMYDFSITPAGICTGLFGSGGKLDLFPTATAFGTVQVTVTAEDATGGFASHTFQVTLRPDKMFVSMNTPAAPALQDGATWATAYRHLQDGLTRAVEGQEIWVAQGIYHPDVDNAANTDARDRTFAMVRKVSMYGGFVGGETTREARDPYLRPTILSGDINQDDLQQPVVTRTNPQSGDLNNSYRVVDMSACYGVEEFDGFIVTAGRADVFPDHADGAGIYALENVNIANCWITGNFAANGGAGLYIFDNNPIISRCRLTGNEASVAGGGVYARKGAADFYNCEFRGNKASDGGGLYLEDPNLDFLNCVMSGNNGLIGGGAIHMAGGKLQVINSTLSGNHTPGQGGALKIIAAAEKPEFKNVILWNNEGEGSISSAVASTSFIESGDAPKFYNSIVANSGGSAAWDLAIGIDLGGNLDLDPGFVSALPPSMFSSEAGVFHLLPGSPALNAGLQSVLLADRADLDGDGDTGEDVDVDLAGNARVTGSEIEMGAYEFTVQGSPNTLDSDGDGLSDEFEAANGGDLDPMDDLDGDGLTALAEFVHGLDPNEPLAKPVTRTATTDYLGSSYLTLSFEIDPAALPFTVITVERGNDQLATLGWQESQTIEISSVPSSTRPGLLEVTYRSLVPFGQERMEFLRVRHEVLTVTGPSIPEGATNNPWTSGLNGLTQ